VRQWRPYHTSHAPYVTPTVKVFTLPEDGDVELDVRFFAFAKKRPRAKRETTKVRPDSTGLTTGYGDKDQTPLALTHLTQTGYTIKQTSRAL
jgi:hypothetical protein